jgi:hypothetical protein
MYSIGITVTVTNNNVRIEHTVFAVGFSLTPQEYSRSSYNPYPSGAC